MLVGTIMIVAFVVFGILFCYYSLCAKDPNEAVEGTGEDQARGEESDEEKDLDASKAGLIDASMVKNYQVQN